MKNDYDAFISYRRGDASSIAHWIRHRLLKYKLPDDVLKILSAQAKALHEQRPRIFFDRAYEKSNEDFLNSKIFPALDASNRLIVISTPSVFDNIRESNGAEAPNWLVREIDYFVSNPNASASRKIDLVLGPEGNEQLFPGRLAEKARWDWIDLRAYNKWRSFGFSEELDTGFLKLIASIYDVPEEALPLLRREERRRRQKLIVALFAGALFFTAIISILAIGWWGEIKSRQATELERQQAEARNLLDVGSIPNAVNILAKIVLENGETNAPEATRLLKAWAKRLVTARDELETVPKNSVIRWRGRNYLRNDNGVSFSFDGPSVLLGGVSLEKWLISFEADRVLRVRELSTSTLPILETPKISAVPKFISEYFQGKLLMFEANGLEPYGEYSEDLVFSQAEDREILVVLDPNTRVYATLESYDGIKFSVAENCVQVKSSSVNLVAPNQPSKIEKDQVLTVSQSLDGSIGWSLGETASCKLKTTEATTDFHHELDGKRVLATASEDNDMHSNLNFPKLLDESFFWRRVNSAPPKISTIDICTADNENQDCYNIEQVSSIYPESGDTLEAIFKSPININQLESIPRVIITSALGDQIFGTAICKVDIHKIIRDCVAAASGISASAELVAGGRFIKLSERAVYQDAFKLIDIETLRFIQIKPEPIEVLTSFDVSSEGKWMAALTKEGEVWLYKLKRESGEATVISRFNFRSMINNPGANTPPESAQGGENVQDQFFDSAFFVSENRLVLAGSLGGIVLVEIPGGNTIWSRIPIALSGNSAQKVAVAGDTLAIYNMDSIQLVSLESGALLSNIMNFKDLPLNADDKVNQLETPVVERGPSGRIRVIYRGAIIEPLSDFPVPNLDSVEQSTGISRKGTDELLSYYLKNKGDL